MNKKIFGIKVSSLLILLMCFVCALAVWLYAKISSQTALDAATAFASCFLMG